MQLHTCPSCKNDGLYAGEQSAAVTCRSCGHAFRPTVLTRVDAPSLVRGARHAVLRIRSGLGRPLAVYVAAGVALLLFVWCSISILGLLPDELRILNRRFVGADDWEGLQAATGRLVIGSVIERGKIEVIGHGTCWALSNDGYFVTAGHVLDSQRLSVLVPNLGLWVFLGEQRHDARVIWADSLTDLALIHVDAYIPKRFRVASDADTPRLNRPVTAVGYPVLPSAADSANQRPELAVTTGAISRVFRDEARTRWIEHTAALRPGASGGPLLVGGRVVGVNVTAEGTLYQAIDVIEFGERLERYIAADRDRE